MSVLRRAPCSAGLIGRNLKCFECYNLKVGNGRGSWDCNKKKAEDGKIKGVEFGLEGSTERRKGSATCLNKIYALVRWAAVGFHTGMPGQKFGGLCLWSVGSLGLQDMEISPISLD